MLVVARSHGERSRYDTLLRFERSELRAQDAAVLLGVGRRQIYRLLERLGLRVQPAWPHASAAARVSTCPQSSLVSERHSPFTDYCFDCRKVSIRR